MLEVLTQLSSISLELGHIKKLKQTQMMTLPGMNGVLNHTSNLATEKPGNKLTQHLATQLQKILYKHEWATLPKLFKPKCCANGLTL